MKSIPCSLKKDASNKDVIETINELIEYLKFDIE